MDSGTLRERIDALAPWYHRIELAEGLVTPGDRAQDIVFALYGDLLPEDMTGMSVIDLGANAAGLSIEFARRGADVVALESVKRSCDQARLVVEALGLEDRITIEHADVYDLAHDDRVFDVVAYVGLSYHLRYPQLALDMLSRRCGKFLLASTQTIEGAGLVATNRAAGLEDREVGTLYGWEPTEELFIDMMSHAGFRNAVLVSTAPHPGEEPGRVCGNRSYFWAEAPATPATLPFVDDERFTGKAENLHRPPADFDLDPLLLLDEARQASAAQRRRIEELDAAIAARNARIEELDGAVRQRDRRLEELGEAITQRDTRRDELQRAVEQRDTRVDELGRAIEQRDARIAELDSAIVGRDGKNRSLQRDLKDRDQHIEVLLDHVKKLEADVEELRSRRWYQRR